MTNNPTEQVSPQPSLGKDSSAKRDSNAQAVEPKSGDGCTDLQAALRKACEDAAKYLPEPRGISDADVADIIERHLTPVFEALVAAAYAACANNCLNSAHALEQLVAENPEDAERFREAITWLKAKYLHLNALTPADAAWELERRALEAVLGEATWWKQFSPNAWEAALTERVREYEKRLASLSKPAPVEEHR